jgi:uncharacterized protein YerC
MPSLSLPLVSSFSSRDAWERAAWDAIVASIAQQRDPETLSRFLCIVLGANERKNMIRRAAVLTYIKNGNSYREIGNELWAAPQMISALVKALREPSYRSYHERSRTERVKRTYTSSLSSYKPRMKRVRTKYGTREIRR